MDRNLLIGRENLAPIYGELSPAQARWAEDLLANRRYRGESFGMRGRGDDMSASAYGPGGIVYSWIVTRDGSEVLSDELGMEMYET